MSNYTMTFYCRDCLAIPEDAGMRQRHVREQVLDKMQQRKLELVDFNLTENYQDYPEHSSRGNHRTLVEIKLDLTRMDLRSRDAIFIRCLNALQQDEVFLSDFTDGNEDSREQSVLIFDMKSHAQQAS